MTSFSKFLVLIPLLSIVGCHQESAEVKDFRKAVSVFLSEARADAKLALLSPTLQQMQEKHNFLKELQSRIPDVPAGIDKHGILPKHFDDITEGVGRAVKWAGFKAQLPGISSNDGANKALRSIHEEDAAYIVKLCNEVDESIK